MSEAAARWTSKVAALAMSTVGQSTGDVTTPSTNEVALAARSVSEAAARSTSDSGVAAPLMSTVGQLTGDVAALSLSFPDPPSGRLVQC